MTYAEIAKQVAELVEEKEKAYGSSFYKAGAVLAILYPNGIVPEQLDDALTIVRVVDKLFRIATDRDAFGEDPWRDVLGYALLSVARRERQKAKDESPDRSCPDCDCTLREPIYRCWPCFAKFDPKEYRRLVKEGIAPKVEEAK
jgi:hypothetical protein